MSAARLRREIELFVENATSDEAMRTLFLGSAREYLAEHREDWRRAIGAAAEFERFVDGQEGAPLEGIRIPGGVVMQRIAGVQRQAAARVVELFDRHTKVVTGGYQGEHRVWVNEKPGAFRAPDVGPKDTIDVVNLSVFARRAEVRGYNDAESAGFPDGLMAGVAAQAKREFKGQPVSIYPVWDSYGGRRLPAVRIT